jgi:hypothetical protein
VLDIHQIAVDSKFLEVLGHMAAAEDRKRRYPVDSPDSNIQVTRQPPKKRFLSSTPTSPTGNQAVDMDDDQQVADDPNDPFKVTLSFIRTPHLLGNAFVPHVAILTILIGFWSVL